MNTVLIDIDGVLTVSWRPLPGAVAAVSRLRAAGLKIALLTNTTSRTRASIAATLAGAGFPVTVGDILTAPALAAGYLAEHYPGARCLLLNSGDIRADLEGVTLVDDRPDIVLIGGAGPEFGYQALNQVFGHVQEGARLLALQRNLYWRTDAGLQLDAGAFLVGLEQAAGVTAEVIGKPAAAFFQAALATLRADPAEAVMIGDDIEADVLAAQRAGITGILVRTGKYLPRALQSASGTPDHVVDSIAGVPPVLLSRP
jgi:HAD superfamily hydrolase (TIGR01458 family)